VIALAGDGIEGRLRAARFGVDETDALARKDYDEVIRFLLDLRIGDTTAN
jgi:hypothetical protein